MTYRRLVLAPLSQVASDRRGAVRGRFCTVCGGIYPRWAARHSGKPMFGKDHVAAPCTQEGEPFEPGDSWWEPAVELAAAAAAAEGGDGDATSAAAE